MEMNMVTIIVNGKNFEVSQEKNLLHTCLGLGIDIPYFCFHPAMGSVGACRQCAVKKYANADDKRGRIVMSCMEPVADGLIISTDDAEVKAFRKMVIEGLMTNHPHDCPICDEGGECHLQDMTVMTGHSYRRFNFKKRTYKNQYLGPFVQHEMNRCIQCYRCVRFYRDYAGGNDFNVFGTASRVYFGRHDDGILENEFSGNLVEVCPTGVFTDKSLKDHYTRKWDLTHSPSVCVHCSVGCNTITGERYGRVRRTINRYNADVNEYFLCDRGRYGYQFLNSPERISNIMVRKSRNEPFADAGKEEFTSAVHSVLKAGSIAGIGTARASLESNFALESLVGKENLYSGLPVQRHELVKKAINLCMSNPGGTASLKDIRESDAVLILGEDLTNTAPVMALAVRQATRNLSFAMAAAQKIPAWNDYPVRELAQDARSPIFIGSPFGTKLDDVSAGNYRGSPDEIATLGFLTASMIDTSLPSPVIKDKQVAVLSGEIAIALLKAERPVIITGLTNNNEFLLRSAADICHALSASGRKSKLAVVFPESNSAGLGLTDAKPIDELIKRVENDGINTLIILENDLHMRIEDADLLLQKCRNVIVIDHLMTPTAAKADILLPAGTYAESTGTVVNYEGRAQRFYSILPEQGFIKDSWRHLAELMKIAGKEIKWETADDIGEAMGLEYPIFSGINTGLQNSGFRLMNDRIARQTSRFSGRTAIEANVKLHEPKPPIDPDSPLSYTMEGYQGIAPANLTPYYWSPGWNSVNSLAKLSEERLFRDGKGSFGVLLFKNGDDVSGGPHSEFPPEPDSEDSLLIVPAERIFGSEELSSRSRAVSGLIPASFILMNRKTAGKFRSDDDHFLLKTANAVLKVKISIDDSMTDGTGALFLKENAWLDLPLRIRPGQKKTEL